MSQEIKLKPFQVEAQVLKVSVAHSWTLGILPRSLSFDYLWLSTCVPEIHGAATMHLCKYKKNLLLKRPKGKQPLHKYFKSQSLLLGTSTAFQTEKSLLCSFSRLIMHGSLQTETLQPWLGLGWTQRQQALQSGSALQCCCCLASAAQTAGRASSHPLVKTS